MAFGVGDSLRVRISAATGDFERGVESAQNKLTGLAATATGVASPAMQLLAGRADEAGDEIDETGRSASRTAATFTALTAGTEGLALSFGALSSSTTLTLIPALAALSTILIPLTATVGGLAAAAASLAGAFGLVIGSGIIAFGKQRGEQAREELQLVQARIRGLERLEDQQGDLTAAQQEELDTLEERADKLEEQTGIMGGLQSAMADLREEIEPMIVEFGEQFVPLIEDAIDAIPDLVENILGAVGGMGEFEQALRDFGNAAFRAIPQIVSAMMDLARRALPALRDLGVWLLENGPRIFRSMMDVTREMIPVLMQFIQGVIDATPQLTRFGTALSQYLIPGLTATINAIGGVVDWWNNLNGALKTGIIIALAGAIAILSGGVLGFVAALIAANEIWNVLKAGFSWLVDTGAKLIDGSLQLLVSSMELLRGAIQGIVDGLGWLMGRTVEAALEIPGLEMISDLVSGLLSNLQDIVGRVWDTIVDVAFKVLPEVDSPQIGAGRTEGREARFAGTGTNPATQREETPLLDSATIDVNVSVDQQGRLVTETDVRDANATGRNTTNLNP